MFAGIFVAVEKKHCGLPCLFARKAVYSCAGARGS